MRIRNIHLLLITQVTYIIINGYFGQIDKNIRMITLTILIMILYPILNNQLIIHFTQTLHIPRDIIL